MTILVTGGAGYIGSVVTSELLSEGYEVVVLDDLRQGHHEAIPSGAQFSLTDICDAEALEELFQRFNISAVIHMAAETEVEHSMKDPTGHFQTNVLGGIRLLQAMIKNQCLRLIFSSTAAVYGEPQSIPITDDHPENPINVYGESKLMFERILKWYGKAYGLRYVCLRYFNAAGASQYFGEDHHPETHLIPNVLRAALDQSQPVAVFGTDYPTKDGSCIRDYVHVLDISQAHLLALEKLDSLNSMVYNLGNGSGYSVLEVIKAAREITEVDIPVEISARRLGDPSELVASSNRAKRELGWAPKFPGLHDIIESTWRWMLEHPNGYDH
jgi:UDP-glucose 4-epimerase